MKKAFSVLAVLVLGVLSSFGSILYYGSSQPNYILDESEREMCKALVQWPPEYKEISYERGFPLQIAGVNEVNITCNSIDDYTPSPGEIVKYWQFYANWLIYSVATGMIFLIIRQIKLKRHPFSQ